MHRLCMHVCDHSILICAHSVEISVHHITMHHRRRDMSEILKRWSSQSEGKRWMLLPAAKKEEIALVAQSTGKDSWLNRAKTATGRLKRMYQSHPLVSRLVSLELIKSVSALVFPFEALKFELTSLSSMRLDKPRFILFINTFRLQITPLFAP